jgi:hypothetical protein
MNVRLVLPRGPQTNWTIRTYGGRIAAIAGEFTATDAVCVGRDERDGRPLMQHVVFCDFTITNKDEEAVRQLAAAISNELNCTIRVTIDGIKVVP